MYHMDELLAQICLEPGEGEKQFVLRDYVPIGRILKEGGSCTVSLADMDGKFCSVCGDHGGNRTARILKVTGEGPCRVSFFVGSGWWAEPDGAYTDAMHRFSGWAGSDGINSFNLKDGVDAYGADTDATLFVFGDTLVSEVDRKTDRRLQPVYMPNNTYGIMGKTPADLEFYLNRDENGIPRASLIPSPEVAEPEEWFWLQDGIVLDRKLYLSPLVVGPDLSRPEGYQFRVTGVAMAVIPIEENRPVFEKAVQYRTRLYAETDTYRYTGGIAYMPYTREAGWEDGDGYIYIYGYRSRVDQLKSSELIVCRTLPQDFGCEEKWRWFDGEGWNGTDILQSAPLLSAVSAEMSVMPIRGGANDGRFLAVFQKHVESDTLAYAVGDTPAGPFASAQAVWHCDENPRIDPTVYTYNAKAHCHLSTPDSILASYNVNTPSWEINCRFGSIYRPRFLRLHDTTLEGGCRG